ncbi:MAG: DUF4292 domain-containing protein [Cyclobacteriaceae bacterium]|nr:DUF4292 domain-containing protein [Cyclobacteriaceae bacterium]
MRTNFFALLLLTSLGLVSCSKKSLLPWEYSGGRLEINEMDFDYFQGKTKMNFKDESLDIKAKATIRIRKDSIIWMTFSSAGITGGRCLINKDSITIISTLKNEYYVFEYPEMSARFNFDVNYETLQAAAIGNLIMGRKQNDRKAEKDDFLVLRQKSGSVSVENYINRNTHKIVRVDMTEVPSKNTASIHYNDFQLVNDQYFPFSGIISLFYKSKENVLFSTVIEFEYSKVEIIEKDLRFPFKIPKKYVRR